MMRVLEASVLDIDKLDWRASKRAWVGTRNPYDETDTDLFYSMSTITIGDSQFMKFLHAPWLNDRKPKDVAPLIFRVSRMTNGNIKKELEGSGWIPKIDTSACIDLHQLREFSPFVC
jgi:hypothetical protein